MNLSNLGGLLTLQATSKELGIPKKDVQALVATGSLVSVNAGKNTYITRQSVIGLLGQNEPADFGQQCYGYLPEEELSCALTKNELAFEPEKEGSAMIYKGSVSALKDGRFMVQIDKGKTPEGKRDRESKSFRDEEQANQYLEQRLKELNAPKVQPVQVVAPVSAIPVAPQEIYTDKTFEDYCMEQLNSGIGKAHGRTVEGYRVSLLPVIKIIGKEKIAEITKADLKKLFDKLAYDYAKSSLRKSYNSTKMIFDLALDNGDIPNTPFQRLKCPTSRKVSNNEREPYTDEDIETLFRMSKDYYHPMVYPLLAVLECTGMRPGELRALEWSSFDAKEKTIRIVQAVSKEYDEIENMKKHAKAHEIVTVTKSAYGKRKLRLSDLAVDALLEWRKYLDSQPTPMKKSKFIFPNKQGDFTRESALRSILKRFVTLPEIEDMGFMLYRFRHTMCTRLILDDRPIPVIQRLMGDNTPDVIMKIYTHINEEKAMASAEGFYDRLNEKHSEIA